MKFLFGLVTAFCMGMDSRIQDTTQQNIHSKSLNPTCKARAETARKDGRV